MVGQSGLGTGTHIIGDEESLGGPSCSDRLESPILSGARGTIQVPWTGEKGPDGPSPLISGRIHCARTTPIRAVVPDRGRPVLDSSF